MKKSLVNPDPTLRIVQEMKSDLLVLDRERHTPARIEREQELPMFFALMVHSIPYYPYGPLDFAQADVISRAVGVRKSRNPWKFRILGALTD